jgi:hypothetical protein
MQSIVRSPFCPLAEDRIIHVEPEASGQRTKLLWYYVVSLNHDSRQSAAESTHCHQVRSKVLTGELKQVSEIPAGHTFRCLR